MRRWEMSRVTEDEAVHREAERVVNYLASAGELGRTTVSCAVLREIQLSMGAEMFSRGKSYDICSRPVGGGIHKVFLRERQVGDAW
jgi:hypothetical protein